MGLNVFISRFTASKYTHEVILVQITQCYNVNRHGLLQLRGAYLPWRHTVNGRPKPVLLGGLPSVHWRAEARCKVPIAGQY